MRKTMKKQLLSVSSALILIIGLSNSSCTSNRSNAADSTANATKVEQDTNMRWGLHFDLDKFYNQPDYNIDLSKYSYEELRLLRSIPYARHKHWFKEGEINEKICAIKQYRTDMMPVVKAYAQDKLNKRKSNYWKQWEKNYKKTYDLIVLNKEEKDFVKKVDAKLAEFEKNRHTTQNGLRLYNPDLLVNLSYVNNMSPELKEHLTKDNFGICDVQFDQLFNVYEQYENIPYYITTDLYLHTYHMYFSWLLKYLETKEFLPAIAKLSEDLYKQSLQELTAAKSEKEKDLAAFATTYYAIANQLCTGITFENIPEELRINYGMELSNIASQTDSESEFLDVQSNNTFPYSLFKPRGHYTRNEEAKKYFKAMMWLQTAWFCMDTDNGLQRALYMALQYKKADAATKKLCRSVYNPLEFLIGAPDNIPVIELADLLGSELNIHTTDDLEDPEKLQNARDLLLKKFEAFDKIKPKDEKLMACKNKINFMPQRYTPDAEVLSLMYDEKPNSSRPFPCGLDVMDAFGSSSAANVLDSTDQGAKKWANYEKFRNLARKKFSHFADYDKTMYNKWLESLITLQKQSKSKPDYMRTSAWQRKDLNASLASWAELKHDAVLYAEQPMGAEMGDGGADVINLPKPEYIQHYVEPNLDFWKKLKEMMNLNIYMLKKAGYYDKDNDIKDNSEWLIDKIDLCINVTNKELNDVRLSDEENEKLGYTGGAFEYYTLGIIHPDIKYYGWYDVKGPDSCVALIADVFTRNIPMCKKNGILHAAVANANEIYVVVERNGKTYLTRGAVFDYHEFVDHDMQRFNDEEWQTLLKNKEQKGRPSWTKSLFVKDPVSINKVTGWRDGLVWLLDWDSEKNKIGLGGDESYPILNGLKSE